MNNKHNNLPSNVTTRIRSVAKYSQFNPEALATCPSLSSGRIISSNNSNNNNNNNGTAAIASPKGILLFHTTTPYQPILVLHHSFPTTSKNNTSTTSQQRRHLQFNRKGDRLASSSRDNAILVWDVSGHAFSPLLGSICTPSGSSSSSMSGNSGAVAMGDEDNGIITSIKWKKNDDSSSNQLMTTCRDWIGVWDLRIWNQRMRPSMRFSPNNFVDNANSKTASSVRFVSVSSSAVYGGFEVAALDSSGVVRVYDERKGDSSRGLSLGHFQAHDFCGVGIDSFEYDSTAPAGSVSETNSTNNNELWMTWGLESADTIESSVKLWREGSSKNVKSGSALSGDSSNTTAVAENVSFTCTTKIAVDGLACARVCPYPFGNAIVTISTAKSLTDSTEGCDGTLKDDIDKDSSKQEQTIPRSVWQTDLWFIRASSPAKRGYEVIVEGEESKESPTYEAQSLASFQTGESDDATLSKMVGGKFHGGHLIAVELTIGPGSSFPNKILPSLPSKYEDVKERVKDLDRHTNSLLSSDQDYELILCCLGSTGYLTTHAIPEASLIQRVKTRAIRAVNQITNSHSSKENEMSSHVAMVDRHHTRTVQSVYQSKKDKVEIDGLFGKKNNCDPNLVTSDENQQVHKSQGQSDTNLENENAGQDIIGENLLQEESFLRQQQEQHDPFPFHFSRGGAVVEGGSLQFNLDHNFHKDSELSVSTPVRLAQVNSDEREENDNMLDSVKKEENREPTTIDRLKASNVPCPRLCGASFGITGGIIAFKNGEVRKMWSWFRSEMQAQKGESWTAIKLNMRLEGNGDVNNNACPSELSKSFEMEKTREFPRNMLFLGEMNEAAKVAQWGEDSESDDGADEFVASDIDDSDDYDDSYGDLSSSDSDDFDDAFGEKLSHLEVMDKMSTRGSLYENYFGKANTTTAPTNEEGMEILRRKVDSTNRSRPRGNSFLSSVDPLAPVVFFTQKYDDIVLNGQCSELASMWQLGPYPSSNRLVDRQSNLRVGKSRWNEDEDVETEKENDSVYSDVQRALSFDRSMMNSANIPRNIKSSPNLHLLYQKSIQNESMVGNLQNLFHPSQVESGFPIDKCLEENTSHGRQNTNYKIKPTKMEMDHLRQLNKICIHNANVAFTLGQSDKGDVWNLLSGMVDNMSNDNIFDDFDGWKRFSLGALGRDLLYNILKYYEFQGDVQMLATIVCVFNSGKCPGHQTNSYNMILADEHAPKYDAYVNLYGSLLYGWGQFTVRAELNKHLTNYSLKNQGVGATLGGKESFSLTFALTCPRCYRPANPETNICNSCQDFAFRCAICTNGVRGLFTICTKCGHGGHVGHMMAWFAEQTVCPTGCGCSCTLSTFESASLRDQNMVPLERERRLFATKTLQQGYLSQSTTGGVKPSEDGPG